MGRIKVPLLTYGRSIDLSYYFYMIVLWRSYQFDYVQFLGDGRRWLDVFACCWLGVVSRWSGVHKFITVMAWYNLISLEPLNNLDCLIFDFVRWTHKWLQAALRRHWDFRPKNHPLVSRWYVVLIRLGWNRFKFYFLRLGADSRFWWIFLGYSFWWGWTLFCIRTLNCLGRWVPFRLGPRCTTACSSWLLLVFNCLWRPASWLSLPFVGSNTGTMSLLLLRCFLLVSRVSLLFLLHPHRYFRL